MAIKNFTFRFTCIIDYTDGSKGSFAGVYDGKNRFAPAATDDGKAAFHQTSIIGAFEDILADPHHPTTTSINFDYASNSAGTPPAYPTGTRAPFKDMVLSMSGNVAYTNGSNGSFDAQYQRGINFASSITNTHLLALLNDSASVSIIDQVLTSAAGFTLTLV